MPDAASASALPAVGEQVGKYRIERCIGRGGMGAVYQARHLVLDQLVAIKVLLPEFAATPGASQRFYNEARAAAQIRNEHVARVLDVESLPGGISYMVLEYLDGADLATLVERGGPLGTREAAGYLMQALQALAQAHAMGIVHRDFKPANLFLANRPDGTTTIKVLDFGISKADRTSTPASGITSTNSMLGSPSFMSPEQVRSAKNVDPRSDLWSAGVSLYYLTTGALPFKGETYGEVFAAVLDPGPARVPSSENPALPPEFDALVSRCLARDREQRFADAAALAEALAPLASEADRAAVDRIRRILAAAPNTPRFTQSQPILAVNLTNAPARTTPPPPAPTFVAPSALDSPDTLIPGATQTEDEDTAGAAPGPTDTPDTFIPELAEPSHPTEPATPPPATLKREAVRAAPQPSPEPEDSSATVPGMPAFSMDDFEDEVTLPHAPLKQPPARRNRGLLVLLAALALGAASVTGYLAFRAVTSQPTPPSQGP